MDQFNGGSLFRMDYRGIKIVGFAIMKQINLMEDSRSKWIAGCLIVGFVNMDKLNLIEDRYSKWISGHLNRGICYHGSTLF